MVATQDLQIDIKYDINRPSVRHEHMGCTYQPQGSHNSAEAEIPKAKEMTIYCANTTKRYLRCGTVPPFSPSRGGCLLNHKTVLRSLHRVGQVQGRKKVVRKRRALKHNLDRRQKTIPGRVANFNLASCASCASCMSCASCLRPFETLLPSLFFRRARVAASEGASGWRATIDWGGGFAPSFTRSSWRTASTCLVGSANLSAPNRTARPATASAVCGMPCK